jgi:hypothetical protein
VTKKVVGVFVRFSCAASLLNTIFLQNIFQAATINSDSKFEGQDCGRSRRGKDLGIHDCHQNWRTVVISHRSLELFITSLQEQPVAIVTGAARGIS